MDARGIRGILITLCCCLLQQIKGSINMQGCTEGFFRMTCPDDDILHVYDVRFSEVETGHPCQKTHAPENATVPRELVETCFPGNETAQGHMCTYVEDICAGKTECVFYISPHLIAGRETPNVNSEVIINYECKAGKKRKAEVGVAALVATVSIISLLAIGGLLMWRLLTQDTSTYADFTNNQSRPTPVPRPSSSGLSYRTHEGAPPVNDDNISVELRSGPVAGVSHVSA